MAVKHSLVVQVLHTDKVVGSNPIAATMEAKHQQISQHAATLRWDALDRPSGIGVLTEVGSNPATSTIAQRGGQHGQGNLPMGTA